MKSAVNRNCTGSIDSFLRGAGREMMSTPDNGRRSNQDVAFSARTAVQAVHMNTTELSQVRLRGTRRENDRRREEAY